MIWYIVRRVAQAIPLIIVVALLSFIMTRMIPGDPAQYLLGTQASQEDIRSMQERFGLNEPLLTQLVNWLLGLLKGNLGVSYVSGQEVSSVIGSHLEVTLFLALGGTLVSIIFGVPMAIIAAVNKGKAVDSGVRIVSLFAVSIPIFVSAVFLVILFSVKLRLLPSQGYVSIFEDPVRSLKHMVLPCLSLGIMVSAVLTRVGRASMLETLQIDFVLTAKISKLSKASVYLKHALRNALIPMVTVMGLTFGTLVGGTIVTERVFNLAGLGTMLMNGIVRRDYPTIQAGILLIALTYLVINLLVDLSYSLINPRVRHVNA